MKNLKTSIVLLAGILFCSSLFAQTALKRANKQYELSVFDQAVNSYLEVLKKVPDHREANAKLGDSYRHLNEFEKAIPYYQTAIAQGGIDDLYVFQYGLTLQGLGRYKLAKQVFEKLAENAPAFTTRGRQFAEACQFASEQHDPPRYKISNEYLNTAAADFGPAIFKGNRIIYSSSRTDISSRNSRSAPASTGSRGANRLLITQRDKNGFLEMPVVLHSGFGNAVNEGPVAYSNDGKSVAVTKNNFTNGIRQIPSSGLELTLYVAEVDGNGDWTSANPFPHNGVGYSTGYGSFSPDGKALFFASDRPGGYGGFDLYVSYRVGNTWSAPENLGMTINSIGNEITPFYDGASLYFASDFHRGFGGFDIFRAEETNNRWSTIFHGGTGLNSSYDDFGFVFDPLRNTGYFVSNRLGGKGNEDLYKVEKETDNVVIKVKDAATGKAIAAAEIDFSQCGDQSYQTDANGVFNFQLLDDLNCTVIVRKEGYMSAPVMITSLGLRQNRTLNIELTDLKSAYQGKSINASTGYFLEDVKIIATEQGTGNQVTAYSDLKGNYFISLKPNANYLLRFSKAGFQDVTLNLRTAANDNKILRNVDLLPVGATVALTEYNEPNDPATAAGGTTGGGAAKSIPADGYSIQVAALSSNSRDIGSYKTKLGDLGTVYSVEEGGKIKVRVGIFSNRSDALDVQRKIRSKGYKGAFVVEEKNRLVAAPASTQNTKETNTAGTGTSSVKNLNGFMVRLATYGNLKFFDKETVNDIGVITQIPKGDLTIVLLSGYDSKASAEIALRKAIVRGYPEAHIVQVVKGEIQKVQ